jgi:hypothetical protein
MRLELGDISALEKGLAVECHGLYIWSEEWDGNLLQQLSTFTWYCTLLIFAGIHSIPQSTSERNLFALIV